MAHFYLPKLFLVSLSLSTLYYSAIYYSQYDICLFGSNFYVVDDGQAEFGTDIKLEDDLHEVNLVGYFRFDC